MSSEKSRECRVDLLAAVEASCHTSATLSSPGPADCDLAALFSTLTIHRGVNGA